MITGGHNIGRVGVIQLRDKHPGSHEIVRVRDPAGHDIATGKANVFIIGKGSESSVSLPKGKDLRKSVMEEPEAREKAKPMLA